MLWHCWLGGRKSIWPVKSWVIRCLCGYLSGVKCKWFTLLWSIWCYCHPIISCFVIIQNGSAFLVPAYSRCPGKEIVKFVLFLLLLLLPRFSGMQNIVTSVSAGLWLFMRGYLKSQVAELSQIFLCLLPVAMARSSSDGITVGDYTFWISPWLRLLD